MKINEHIDTNQGRKINIKENKVSLKEYTKKIMTDLTKKMLHI